MERIHPLNPFHPLRDFQILSFTYALDAFLMMAVAVGLWLWLRRRWPEAFTWRLVVIGGLMFSLSQVVRLPLLGGLTALFQGGALPSPPQELSFVFNVLVLSLTAGLFEEAARYAGYRWLVQDARSWKQGLVYGAGHGGVEAVILGAIAATTVINMISLRDMDVSTLPIPPEQQAQAARQIAEFWSTPWYLTLLGWVERVFALTLHLSLSVMVLQVFVRRQWRWLFLAMGWHALANAGAVTVLQAYGPLAAEASLAVVALLSLMVIFNFRSDSPAGAQGWSAP
ncbi:MAG: YhfC family glutamic-type intramembrane protease [Anaerolineales bacterium]|nr:YhfC family glutamic-type intramembrane protease [Anaerolineales bacterium]